MEIADNAARHLSEGAIAVTISADALGGTRHPVSRDSRDFNGGGHVGVAIHSDGAVRSGADDDSIRGGAGDDVLPYGDGDDTLAGGPGRTDVISLEAWAAG